MALFSSWVSLFDSKFSSFFFDLGLTAVFLTFDDFIDCFSEVCFSTYRCSNFSVVNFFNPVLKFIFWEGHKILRILFYVVPVKSKVKISQNHVASQNIWTLTKISDKIPWLSKYREFSPYANFITANFITAVFQNYY